MTLDLVIEAIDPLFFRDGLPFNAGDTPYLRCAPMPTPSSGYGLARAIVVEALCQNVQSYVCSGCSGCSQSGRCKVERVVGDPSSRDGTLHTKGPYLRWNTACWHAVPLDLTVSHDDPERLVAGTMQDDPVETDLGTIRLLAQGHIPDLQGDEIQAISEQGMVDYLSGRGVGKNNLIRLVQSIGTHAPLAHERRAGIARDNRSRTTLEGHLYWIESIRFLKDARLIVRVDGLDQLEGDINSESLMPFGGEGKLVRVVPSPYRSMLKATPEKQISESGRFRVVLLQHADFNGSWLPPGFEPTKIDGVTMWTGEVNGVRVRLVTAKIGKAVQMGGWNTAARRPRDLRSLVPAGSVFCFETDQGQEVSRFIHDRCIGLNTQIGFGHVAVGVW